MTARIAAPVRMACGRMRGAWSSRDALKIGEKIMPSCSSAAPLPTSASDPVNWWI